MTILPDTGPCTLMSLRNAWGEPILWNQPDGERWRKIFETFPQHWFAHSIQLSYPDGTIVYLSNWEDKEVPWTARITYRIYAIANRAKIWYRRNF